MKTTEKQENVVEFKEETEATTEAAEQLERVAPQWIIYNKLCQFLDDDEITISKPVPTEDNKKIFEIAISSKNFHKITAIAKVFVPSLNNVIFKFKYEDYDNEYVRTLTDLFTGNKHFDNIRVATEAMSEIKVVVTTFKDETIQYKADNRFVPKGYETTLAEKLVKEFFNEDYRKSVYVTKEKGSYTTLVAGAGLNGWLSNSLSVCDSTSATSSSITLSPGTSINIGR